MSPSYWILLKKYYSSFWLSWPRVKYLKKIIKIYHFLPCVGRPSQAQEGEELLHFASFHLVQSTTNQSLELFLLHKNFASSVSKCIGELCLKIKGVQYPSFSWFLGKCCLNTLLPLIMVIWCLEVAWVCENVIYFLIWLVMVKFLFYWEFFWFNMILMLGACMMNCNGWKWL